MTLGADIRPQSLKMSDPEQQSIGTVLQRLYGKIISKGRHVDVGKHM